MSLSLKEKKIFRSGFCAGYKKGKTKRSSAKSNKPKYKNGQKIDSASGRFEIVGYDPVRADVHTNRIEYAYRIKTPNGTYSSVPDWEVDRLVKLGRYVPVKDCKKPVKKAAIKSNVRKVKK